MLVTEDREVVIAARFDGHANPDVPYMFHCHVLDHEETGMMGEFQAFGCDAAEPTDTGPGETTSTRSDGPAACSA